MIKVKIPNPTTDRNEPTFRVMMACRDMFKPYSIEITDSDDFDYMFVGMNEFINKSLPLQDSIDWGLENVHKLTQGGDYFLFDGTDSTSLLGSIEVLEQCDAIYLFKNQILKREEYKKPHYCGKWFWGVDEEIGFGYDIKDKDWDRIKLSGLNLGHLNPQFRDQMPPNVYIDKETYFAVNYDWSNLNEVIDEILSDFDRINREVTDNARRKFVQEYQYEDYCFHYYNIFSELNDITIGA